MIDHRVTLTQHLLAEVEHQTPGGGAVASIIAQIATACKEIRAQLAQVGLGPLAGMQGQVNVQGEAVHKLDWYANRVMRRLTSIFFGFILVSLGTYVVGAGMSIFICLTGIACFTFGEMFCPPR